MKNIILSVLTMTFALVSCNQKSKEETATDSVKKKVSSVFSTHEIVNDYLKLKNALTKDDTKGAAAAGKSLYAVFTAAKTDSLDAKQKKEYLDIADDAKEHAEHIGSNDGNIADQRAHFVLLSKNINDLIQLFGSDIKLYQDYCPMADAEKGALWISEIKEIKNPFFGSEMLECGSIQKEL